MLLVALSLSTIALAGATVSQNDAGSGTDAGDSWGTALPLAGSGPFEGNLTGSDTADWYKQKAPAHLPFAVCEQVALTTPVLVDAVLVAIDGTNASAVQAQVMSTRVTHIGVVTREYDGGYLNVSDDPLSPMTTDTYDFLWSGITVAMLPPGDGGSGQDAPSGHNGAVPIPSACFGGHLDGSLDTADTYSFAAQAGDHVTFSLADPVTQTEGTVTDALGNVLGSIPSGGLMTLAMPTSGTYYFTASGPADTSYLVGLCDPQCGPPTAPCNPMCVLGLN